MSGLQVSAKINRAMSKVGRKLGFPCLVYRPDGYANPLQDKNIVSSEVPVAFTVDEAFVRNPVDELAHYKVYVTKEVAQVGDILLFDEGNTIVIVEMEPIRTPSGILANDRINVLRPQNTPLLEKKISLVQICESVPCAVKISNAASFSQPNVTQSSGTTQLEIWTWMPVDELKIADVIEWRGARYQVTSANASDKGTKISATAQKKGT